MARPSRARLLASGGPPAFPDPRGADPDGLVAIGGDLAPARLLAAYCRGIFPWYDEGLPPLWWSPDPRGVIERANLHVSRSLHRRLRQGAHTVTLDTAFSEVMQACASERAQGTWILPEMIDAYVTLHELGSAHSFEVWREGELVGGLYGVAVGGLFAAESMFHRRTDASKIALVAAVATAFAAGFEVFDVQFVTPHLASLGATAIPRDEYLARVAAVRTKAVALGGRAPRGEP